MIPVIQPAANLECLINESQFNYRCKDFLKIATIFMQNPDKIFLTNEEIRTFDLLS